MAEPAFGGSCRSSQLITIGRSTTSGSIAILTLVKEHEHGTGVYAALLTEEAVRLNVFGINIW